MSWGVAGCGWVARDFGAPGIGADRIVALLDPDAASRDRVAARPDAVSTDDLHAFLAAPGLERVYVATPNHLHRAVAEAALAAGKAVLCEKPLAASAEDEAAMRDAALRHDGVLRTAFNQRHHPAHVALREHVAAGGLGQVVQARIHYACTAPPWWTQDDWHWDAARAGGGAVADLAPHGVDLIAHLTCTELVERHVHAQRSLRDADDPIEDGGVVVARYAPGDLLGVVQVSYVTPESYPRRRLELVGTDAMAIASDTMGQDPGGSVELVDARDGSRTALAFDPTADPFARQARWFERQTTRAAA